MNDPDQRCRRCGGVLSPDRSCPGCMLATAGVEDGQREGERIFQVALSYTPEERTAFVAEACGTRSELLAEVRMLLEAFKEQGGDDAMPTLAGEGRSARAAWAAAREEQAGTLIGHFELIRQIGQGGMGAVWEARQTAPVVRRVALKVIKLGMDTVEVVARFERERQSLAQMSNPHIAQVFEAGATVLGRPYFVMELVEGRPITKYCEDKHLEVRERVTLFLDLCGAIEHAHQKGVIHRDLKPSNIMVTREGVAKVIDFGVAKATRDPEDPLRTRLAQVLGTPAYMSPEQAAGDGIDVDTRTDVYALGVLLYELLCGVLPIEAKRLSGSGVTLIHRILLEEEPLRPSTRRHLTRNSAEARQWSRVLQGELDWITMRCLEKNRNNRYASVRALADDLTAWLENRPVQAGPHGAAYYVRKWVSRHRVAFAGGMAVAASLLAGTIVSLTQARRAEQEAARATVAREEAERAREVSHHQEGKAWLERARSLRNDSRIFSAKLTAGNAIGFAGFGREEEDAAFRTACPVLLRADSQEAAEARRILSAPGDYSMLWQSPSSAHHDGPVLGVAFSRDGGLVASCGPGEDVIRLHDPRTGETRRVLASPARRPSALAFSPDGKWLAAGGAGDEVPVWRVADGSLAFSLVGHTREVARLRFSPDGSMLGVAGTSGGVSLWRTADFKSLPAVGDPLGPVLDFGFSEDAGRLAVLTAESTLLIYDGEWGRPLRSISLMLVENPLSMALHPDGRRVFVGFGIGKTRGWETETGTPLPVKFPEFIQGVSSLEISPDGRSLAMGSREGGIRLADLERGKERQRMEGHTGSVRSMVFSQDGGTLVSGGEDCTVRIWMGEDGKSLYTVTGHTAAVNALAFSPDGRAVASAGDDNKIMIWHPGGGEEREIKAGESYQIRCLDFDPSGELLASGGSSGFVRFWQLADGIRAASRKIRHPGGINALRYIGAKALATAGPDGTVRTWNLESGEEVSRHSHHVGEVTSLDVDSGGSRIASGGVDHEVVVWQIGSAGSWRRLEGHASAVTAVRFSPDGHTLASADRGGTLRFWDLDSGTLTNSIINSPQAVTDIDYRADGTRLAASSEDGSLRLWNLTTRKLEAVMEGHQRLVAAVRFSPDGTLLATASADRTVALWEAQGPEVLARHAHGGQVRALVWTDQLLASVGADSRVRAWADDRMRDGHMWDQESGATGCMVTFGDWTVTAGESGQVLVWDAGMTRLTHSFHAHRNRIDAAEFSQDGRYLATAGQDGKVRIWASGNWRLVHEIVLRDPGGARPDVPYSLCFSRDGARLFCAGEKEGRIRNWRTDGWREMLPLSTHTRPVRALSYHPQRDILAAASGDGTVSLWEGEASTPVKLLIHHSGAVLDVRFDPSGRWLASAGEDQTIVVWQVDSWQAAAVFEGHSGAVRRLCFSPDGRRLASGGEDGFVRTWNPVGREPRSYAGSYQRYQNDGFRFISQAATISGSLAIPLISPAFFIPPGSTLAAPEDSSDSVFLNALQARNWRAAAHVLSETGDPPASRVIFCRRLTDAALQARALEGEAELLSLVEAVDAHSLYLKTARVLLALRDGKMSGSDPEVENLLAAPELPDEPALRLAVFRRFLAQTDFAAARAAFEKLPAAGQPEGMRQDAWREYEAALHQSLIRNAEMSGFNNIADLQGMALSCYYQRAILLVTYDRLLLNDLLERIGAWHARIIPPLALIPAGADWNYLDDGAAPPDGWISPDGNAESWRAGPAPLGYSLTWKRTEIRRNLSGDPAKPSTMSFYFRHAFTAPDLGPRRNLLLQTQYDDGIILYLNGEEIRRINMAPGPVSPLTAASEYQNKPGSSSFLIPAALLKSDNLLAAEVHQREPSSSDVYFDATLSAVSATAANWLSSLTPDGIRDCLAWCRENIPGSLAAGWMAGAEFAFAEEATPLPAGMDASLAWLIRARIQADRGRPDASGEAIAKGLGISGDDPDKEAWHRDIRRHLEEMPAW